MAVTVQDYYSTITRSGTLAIFSAGSLGPKIEITGFRIGARSAAEGAIADRNDTDVDDFVYQGSAAQISYQVLAEGDACLFQIVLDENVGDFNVGQIGLMIGNTLFSKSVLYRGENKWRSALPGRLGNTITFNIILNIANVESCVNLTLLKSFYANLPQVETENDLPPAISSTYSTYIVRNHTKTGTMALASKRNNVWNFATQRTIAGNGEGVIPVGVDAFDASVKRNMSVYFDDDTKKFFPADSSNVARFPVGIRSSDFEVTTVGQVVRYTDDDIWPSLTPRTIYSTGESVNVGRPITEARAAPYGMALSSNVMFVDFSYQLHRNYANNETVLGGALPKDNTHGHKLATVEIPGFMSAEDKEKLDGIGTLSLMSAV